MSPDLNVLTFSNFNQGVCYQVQWLLWVPKRAWYGALHCPRTGKDWGSVTILLFMFVWTACVLCSVRLSAQCKALVCLKFVWPASTYGCEAWMLKKMPERHIQAFENRCIRKLLRILLMKMMTRDEWVHISEGQKGTLGPYKNLETAIFCSYHETVSWQQAFRAAWWWVSWRETEDKEGWEYYGLTTTCWTGPDLWMLAWWTLRYTTEDTRQCGSICVANSLEVIWHDMIRIFSFFNLQVAIIYELSLTWR